MKALIRLIPLLRILCLLPLLTASLTAPAAAYDILVVESLKSARYEEAVAGFRSICKRAVRKVFLPELREGDVARLVREEKPLLVLAVGGEALAAVKKIHQVPVVYVMVLAPPASLPSSVSGVAMHLSPEKYFHFMETLRPVPKRVGVLYNGAMSGAYVRRAMKAAHAAGIELVAREVRSPQEVPMLLEDLAGIAALWMLPDPAVVTPETAEAMLLFSQRNLIPLISFSSRYVEMGAVASLDIDPVDMGKQAGEIAARILQEGTDNEERRRVDARACIVNVNRRVMRHLRVTLLQERLHLPLYEQ